MTTHPRKCNGGRTGQWCGVDATVVCTSTREDDGPERLVELFPAIFQAFEQQLGPLQWYACDDAAHQTDATTTPIGQWLAENVPEAAETWK